MLTSEEARALLDSIATVRKTKHPDGTESEEPSLVGLRVKGGVNLDHFGGAKVDQLVKG